MSYRREYLVSYQFQAKNQKGHMVDGWGSMTITLTSRTFVKYLKGYTSKDLHTTRVVVANNIRTFLGGVPKTHKAKVVIMNIVKLPIK